jgi:hypothetical protein
MKADHNARGILIAATCEQFGSMNQLRGDTSAILENQQLPSFTGTA